VPTPTNVLASSVRRFWVRVIVLLIGGPPPRAWSWS
jgi:hypothetical protein